MRPNHSRPAFIAIALTLALSAAGASLSTPVAAMPGPDNPPSPAGASAPLVSAAPGGPPAPDPLVAAAVDSNAGWEEVGAGSASGGGVSNDAGSSYVPSVAVAPDGTPYVAWYDDPASGDEEIYVRRWNGSAWEEVGAGSASAGGISNNAADSSSPSVAVAPNGTPYVAWDDSSGGQSEIYVRRWNGSAWEEVGAGSASGGGISNSPDISYYPVVAIAPDGTPYVAWDDYYNDHEIYVRRWNGSAWAEVGAGSASTGGVSDNDGDSRMVSLAIAPDGTPYVVWEDEGYDDYAEIYVRRWNGSAWEEVGAGSATTVGVSDTEGWGSYNPSVAVAPDGTPYIAWEEEVSLGYQIYVRRWNGSAWVEVGAGSASGGGVSNTAGDSYHASMAVAPDGTPYVAWEDDSGGDGEIYVRRWNGSAWEEVDAGSATAGGVSDNAGTSADASLAFAPGGTPFLAWRDNSGGDPEIYVRRKQSAVSVSHIEVTQGTQDEQNGVPLIAGKPAFARVYVDCGADCASTQAITGVLRAYGPSGELPGSPAMAVNRTVQAESRPWQVQRGDLARTLNFTLPPAWRTGTVTLTAEVGPASYSQAFAFRDAAVPTIIYTPVQYQGLPTTRVRLNHLWAQRIWPTARVTYARWSTFVWRPDPRCASEPDEEARAQCLSRDLTRKLTNRLVLGRGSKGIAGGERLYVFGWLDEDVDIGVPGAADPAWAGGAGRAAFALDLAQDGPELFAHETAHLLGRRHTDTGECGDDDPATDWPYADAKIQEWGLDPAASASGWAAASSSVLVDPDETYDTMSYCWLHWDGGLGRPAWTSPWTFSQIYSETLRLGDPVPKLALEAAEPQAYALASGLVFTDDTSVLDPLWTFTSTQAVADPSDGTAYCLEATDISADPLVTSCFDLPFTDHHTGEPANADAFSRVMPYPAGVARIALRKGAVELAAIEVSANAPVVTVTSPNGGEAWGASGAYTITWTASDTDQNDLTYFVLYSADGSDWAPVAGPITETQAAVDAAEVAGSVAARIEVIATDGANTSSDRSDGTFSVVDKPPWAAIIAPEDGAVIPPGSPLWLYGYAYDLEDGTLEGAALTWSSDQDGALGTGTEALVTLTPGWHTLTLAAGDSSGSAATASVEVFVGHRVYLPAVMRG